MRTLLLVLAVVLAGCSDTSPTPEEDDFALDDDLQATDDTGIIRGVVVDVTITPVAGIDVILEGQARQTTTNAEGAFGFADLEPGAYFLRINEPGYAPVTQSVQVVAGDDKPPVVRLLIEADPTFNPYAETIVHDGFYQCGTSKLVVCGAPNIISELFLDGERITDDTSTHTFYFGEDIQFLQTEMVWRSTQTLSPDLDFEIEALDEGCEPLEDLDDSAYLGGATGASPLRAQVPNATLEEYWVGGEDCGAYHSVFAGGAQGTPAGFSIEQRYEWFVTAFYGFEPSEDWWYIEDGELDPFA